MTAPWPARIATVLAACREAGLPAADREHALSLLARWQRTDEALAWVARRRNERWLRENAVRIGPRQWAV